MVSEYVYSPHVDFFIDRVDRDSGYEMASFHIHHKYEIYYEIEGSRRYFIEDAAYIVNAGCVVLIGENQIHKTASLGDTASSRIVVNFSREYLDKIMDIFPEVDFFSFLSEEHNHLLSNITVKQQNHIQGLLQQLLALQEETSPESDALRKMLLATLLLELKNLWKYVTLDVTREYYEKSLKYMVFGNVLRNGTYPISVSSERIFQGLAIARYANEIGADAIAHAQPVRVTTKSVLI